MAALSTPPGKALLGGSPTTFLIRGEMARQAGAALDIIDHSHSLGLDGCEAQLQDETPEAVRKIRGQVENWGMRVILNAPPPETEADIPAFDARIRACKEAGAIAVYAYLTHRRYEQFESQQAFDAHFAACRKSVALAEPVLHRHRIRLAIENHKGWRAQEQAHWMGELSSEWVGICLDFGNNLALCELPDDTFRLLAPYAVFCHMKDMAVEEHPTGFLLSEVPLGTGIVDLPSRVDWLRRKDPKMLFCLEMITRDPLIIPVLTSEYWRTFSSPATQIPAQDLAGVLRLVRSHASRTDLPRVSHLSPAEALQAEDEYNLACIRYARQCLGM
jgi:3-oxoisoapionate decarboxylase